jgi:methanogenic corrinoid protein MtbC1
MPERSTLIARELLAQLDRVGRSGDLTQCERFVRAALAAGIRPSDVLIGILQPALCEIGKRWQRGEISVSDEHRFTTFATHALHCLPLPDVHSGKERPILLAMVEGNQHDIGIQMLQRVALERGHACLAVHPGLPDDEIVRLASELRPPLLGVSISMSEMIPAGVRLYERLRAQRDGAERVVLGGNAFRQPDAKTPAGIAVLRTIDDFFAALDEIHSKQ